MGQDIYMYLAFRNRGIKYDISRCHVRYDGIVNLPYRQYSVTDHFSLTIPYFGGLDTDLLKDKYQDWVLNQAGSSS